MARALSGREPRFQRALKLAKEILAGGGACGVHAAETVACEGGEWESEGEVK